MDKCTDKTLIVPEKAFRALTLTLLVFLFTPMNVLAANPWLNIGATDTGKYGFSFDGESSNREEAVFDFARGSRTRYLSVRGYDIDSTPEVKVLVNNIEIGNLATSANNGLSTTQLTIPAAVLNGTQNNTVTFAQRNSGARWGITDIQISDPPVLVPGVVDTNSYGYAYPGAVNRLSRADFRIPGKPATALQLQVIGYDIDSMNETTVLLNGEQIGRLAKSENNGFKDTRIDIPRGQFQLGENVLSFVQSISKARWGISDLELVEAQSQLASTQLTVGVANEGKFGYSFDGVLSNPREVTFSYFVTRQQPIDVLTLDIDGYDIDSSTEVAVYVNDVFIGNLAESPNNGLLLTTLPIQINQQNYGTNLIRLEQKNEGARWGVTDVMLSAGCNYPLVIAN